MATSKIPWNEVGIAQAKDLIPSCDKLSRQFKNALAGIAEPGIPNFDSPRWRYEFCIFWMFWTWYVANSPKFTNAGATKPWLDAFHLACIDAMVGAGLIENSDEAIRHWEDDLEEHFLTYKNAYDEHLANIREFPATLSRTLRWNAWDSQTR